MSTYDVLKYVPEKLRTLPIYVKVSELLQYVVDRAYEENRDISEKFKYPETAKEEAIYTTILEFGYEYIADLGDQITSVDKASLIQFISLLHLLKGTRRGLELVLTLLGFTFEITEWWEEGGSGEPMTFNMTVFIGLSGVENVFTTLTNLRSFIRNYVLPKLDDTFVVFDVEFVELTVITAGFVDKEIEGLIEDTL